MKLLVCGGRTFGDAPLVMPQSVELQRAARERAEQERRLIWSFLIDFHQSTPVSLLIHGDARGADRAAGKWAQDAGVQEVICPANWKHFERRAGFLRNKAMLLLQPDLVVAFPGGSGTEDMCRQAEVAGVPVRRVVMPA